MYNMKEQKNAMMRVSDFENAILRLGSDIKIDEMKLKHSDVRQVNGHNKDSLLIWDETGKCHSACKNSDSDTFLTLDEDGRFVATRGIGLKRDPTFDLKFK